MISLEVLASRNNARVLALTRGQKRLSTPCYFPAISKSRMTLASEPALSTILSVRFPRVLVTSYDFGQMTRPTRMRILGEISDFFRNGSFVMLDSGMFERDRNRDFAWSFKEYKKWIKAVDSDFYLSYDLLPRVSMTDKAFFKRTISQIHRSASVTEDSQCVPIIHGAQPGQLIQYFRKFVTNSPQLSKYISVSERDCGKALSDRAITILELRKALKHRHLDSAIHVLGCGDPISMALYAYCGADTFDSLDWSEVVIERNELRIINLSQLELLRCNCKACIRPIKDPQTKAVLHNLRFYQDYEMKLQTMIKRGTLRDYLIEFVGPELVKMLDEHIRGVPQ